MNKSKSIDDVRELGCTSFRVVSFNMQNRIGEMATMRQERLKHIAGLLRSMEPDIVCLQEALLDDYDALKSYMNPPLSVFTPRDDGESIGEGNPIFVFNDAWKQTYSETIWLSSTPHTPSRSWRAAHHRIATIIRLEDEAQEGLLLVNLHLDHRSSLARRNSIALLRQHLLSLMNPEHDEAILCGDFNMAAAQLIDHVSRATKRHAHEEDAEPFRDAAMGFADATLPTFRGIGPFHWFQARLDHCLHTPGLKPIGYRVQDPEWEARMISDHRPIIIDFERKRGDS